MKPQVASAHYIRVTPRKMRAVADVIRGLPVEEAEAQLLLQRRRAAKPLLKLLRSAVANVKNNQHAEISHLYIASIAVDQGPMLKRSLPRARGMATPIQKKTSHVKIVLNENLKLKASRFTIITQKKEKKTSEERVSRPREKRSQELGGEKRRNAGFFRRMFSRKTGT